MHVWDAEDSLTVSGHASERESLTQDIPDRAGFICLYQQDVNITSISLWIFGL